MLMILASTGPERRFGQRPPCRPWSLPHADTRAECAARPKETAHPPGQKMSPAHPGRQPARLVLVRRAHPSAARRCAQGTLVGLTRPFECSGHVLIARADAIHARTLLLIACSHPWWCRCPSAQRPRRRGARLCPCRATVPVRRLAVQMPRCAAIFLRCRAQRLRSVSPNRAAWRGCASSGPGLAMNSASFISRPRVTSRDSNPSCFCHGHGVVVKEAERTYSTHSSASSPGS